LAILLEDIHWADNATLLALRSLAARRPDAPVLWVLTARTGAGGPAVRETLTALEREDARFLRLTAITPNAVADIVQDAVRANADASLLSLADKAHGNPFLLTELLRGLDEEGRLDVSGGRAVAPGDRLPRRLSDTMQQRLDQLSNAASQVVRVAAVLPDWFSARLLAATLDHRPAALVSARSAREHVADRLIRQTRYKSSPEESDRDERFAPLGVPRKPGARCRNERRG